MHPPYLFSVLQTKTGVLASEKYRNLFRDFCEFSFALENLKFYEAVEEFEDLVETHKSRQTRRNSNVLLSAKEKHKLEKEDVAELRAAAFSLMRDYVEEGGDQEVRKIEKRKLLKLNIIRRSIKTKCCEYKRKGYK